MFHPVARLVLWAAAVAALQLLALPVLSAACLLAGLLVGWLARRRGLKLLYRSRWLLLAIAAFFLFGTPGVYLWPSLGAWGPTTEGLHEAAIHLLRLTAIVLLVALLLERSRPAELVAALHQLLAPLAALGLARERMAVRMMLVLDYVQRPGPRHWRDWLDAGAPPADCAPLILEQRALRAADLLLMGAALAGLLLLA